MPAKVKLSLALRQHQRAGAGAGNRFARQLQRQLAPVGAEQADVDRDHERLLERLARRGRAALHELSV